MSDRFAEGQDCQACGMHVDHPAEYHPLLFCELVKLGHRRPADYLAGALPGALLLMPSRAGDNAADHFRIVPTDSPDAP